jgi:hypothetical protein
MFLSAGMFINFFLNKYTFFFLDMINPSICSYSKSKSFSTKNENCFCILYRAALFIVAAKAGIKEILTRVWTGLFSVKMGIKAEFFITILIKGG